LIGLSFSPPAFGFLTDPTLVPGALFAPPSRMEAALSANFHFALLRGFEAVC